MGFDIFTDSMLIIIFYLGSKSSAELMGVIPRSFDHVFNHIGRTENKQYLVRASYLEIYQEEIRDLLSKDQSKRLELKERPDTGVYVKVWWGEYIYSITSLDQLDPKKAGSNIKPLPDTAYKDSSWAVKKFKKHTKFVYRTGKNSDVWFDILKPYVRH